MFGFIEWIEHGWDMAVESLSVLRKDKELLVFPLLSLMACLLVIASFAWPLYMQAVDEKLLHRFEKRVLGEALSA